VTDPHTPTRREFLLAVCGSSVVAGTGVGATMARFSDEADAEVTFQTAVWGEPIRLSYTDTGALRTLLDETEPDAYSVSDVVALGPADTGYANAAYRIPILDSGGNLSLVDDTGSVTSLATGSVSPRTPASSGQQGALASAAWDDNPRSVYFAGETDIYRVAPGEDAPTQVASLGNGATAVYGTGDVNGDRKPELVYADGSQTLRYIVPAGETGSRSFATTGVSPGGGYGAGAPASIDGRTVVPAVNGSGDIGLIGPNGWLSGQKSLTGKTVASKAPVAAGDVDGDGDNEIVFVGSIDGYLKYVTDIGGSNAVETVRNGSGEAVFADTKNGVH
jgi:hypothetical protein